MKFLTALREMLSKSSKLAQNTVTKSANRVTTPTTLTQVIPQIVVLHEGDILRLELDGWPILSPMRVVSKIDTGGFGTVFIVEMNGKEYALKVLTLWLKLPNEWADLIKRFESSFRAGKINSNYIITYHEKGYYKGNPCILMEYCPNGHLESRMEEYHDKEKWISLGVDLLNALQDLHMNGIIHKDFKPKNILFSADNVPKLTDFDFSAFLDKRNTITKGGRALDLWYTAIYSPPEQIDPNLAYEKTSPPVDMFAFGVTMYQVITKGKLPWGSFEEYHENPDAYYEKIKKGDFVPISVFRPDVPSHWAYNLERCLHPKIEDRVQTPAQFLQSVNYKKPVISLPVVQNIVAEEIATVSTNTKASLHKLEIKAGANNIGLQVVLEEILKKNGHQDIVIGRSKDNPIYIDAILPMEGFHHVSRRHATLRFRDNQWSICDGAFVDINYNEGSKNGTEVFNPITGGNNVVPTDKFIKLSEEDIINLAGGEVTLKFFKVKN